VPVVRACRMPIRCTSGPAAVLASRKPSEPAKNVMPIWARLTP